MIEIMLLDYDILGMCNSINNNIELTTDSNVHFTAQEIVKITNCLQELHQDCTKEEIIALAQKIMIEDVIHNNG